MRAPALKKGDVIGIYSPSAPASATAPKRFGRAVSFLEEKGFKIRPGKLTGRKDVYRAGGIRERAEELNELLRDPSVACVMPVMGGLCANAILPHIDYDAIRENPKVVVGYSDAIVILLAVYAKTGLIPFCGPSLVPSFGEFPPFVEDTWKSFENMVTGTAGPPFALVPPRFWTDDFMNWEEKTGEKSRHENRWAAVLGGRASGRLIGGTLNAISGIFGTPYMPEIREGDVLLVEDTSKDPAYLERLFSMLKLAGVFDRVSGVLLGKHERFNDLGTGRRPADILLEVLDGRKIPVLADFDCCHTLPLLTMPIGVPVEIDVGRCSVKILEPWLHGQRA